MDEITPQILHTIKEKHTIRIVVDVPTHTLPPDNILNAASDLIKPLTQTLESEHNHAPKTHFLAVDVYPRHTYIVLDINNTRYDYSTAHLAEQMFPIPVYILRRCLSKRAPTTTTSGGDDDDDTHRWIFFRRPVEDQRLAVTIAELHRCNGSDPTPFLADHV
ncbi:uncharacterized protein LDX57_013008 [Aspergillus melleus]|uniref:uncharacterized protein n=1 Tax=Aspergillus melleus TaxID=138277 RepID=UPI001E8CEDE8|nr:uncharacterized protein LDX57_013008 [Aspergillus melleus]KAH8435378.1 hypothetical protein LDX57_013008 [Aspergillus melleus]